MKKLFTILMAMALVTMSFAQISPKPIYALDEPVSMSERSDWYGYTSSEYFTQYDEGDIYFVTFPAVGTAQANSTIDKVCFGWQENGTVSGSQVNFDPNFKIVIYVGGNTDWLDTNPVVSQNTGWSTEDLNNMGTRVYEQTVDASAVTSRGVVTVNLTTPYNISNANGQQIWVGIECLGNTCGYIGNLDNPDYNYDWRINLQKYTAQTGAEKLAPFLYCADDDCTTIFAGKACLGVYLNDGAGYQPKSDFVTEIYAPDDEATYPDPITWLEIDQFTDSLYFYGGTFNMGVDQAYGLYYRSIYLLNGDERIDVLEASQLNDEDNVPQTLDMYYGWRMGPFAIMGVEDFDALNLTYPFQMCLEVSYQSDASYNGVDPDLSNNIYCITVSDQPDPNIGIQENTNTLSVSPNPASTYIKVENAAGSQISVYNIAGQEVMSIESAEANETLNVSNLNAGLYIVRVVNGTEVSTAKVSIVR